MGFRPDASTVYKCPGTNLGWATQNLLDNADDSGVVFAMEFRIAEAKRGEESLVSLWAAARNFRVFFSPTMGEVLCDLPRSNTVHDDFARVKGK